MRLERVTKKNKNKKNFFEPNISMLQDMCGYFTPLGSWVREQLESASDIVYAIEDDSLYGYIILDKKKGHVEVELICVGEEGRKQKGVGSALMKKAEEIAKEYGLSELALDSQFQAEGFYKKLNFKEVSRNNLGVRMKKVIH
jgi:ribosomal protein S18 acetylase RimI-like enzyme